MKSRTRSLDARSRPLGVRRRVAVTGLIALVMGPVMFIPLRASADIPVGGAVELEGLRNTRIYNPKTNHWDQVGNMSFGRWYPMVNKLPDGKLVVTSGVTKLVKNYRASQVRVSETFDPATNKWTLNNAGPESLKSFPLYPRMRLTPNGKLFYDGNGQSWGPFGQSPDEFQWATRTFYNPETRKYEDQGPAPLGSRSAAADGTLVMKPPYDKMTIVEAGGALGPSPDSLLAIKKTAETTVDKAGDITTRMTGDMNYARWFGNMVTLPTGQLMVFNGGDKDEVISPGSEAPIERAELYDPVDKTWTKMAVAHRERTYHNSAILLPDGSVLVGGLAPIPKDYTFHKDIPVGPDQNAADPPALPASDLANNDRDSSLEIYRPPYLSMGKRPEIDNAQSGMKWGSKYTITTKDARGVDNVVVSALPANNHAHDMNTRTLELKILKRTSRSLVVRAPSSGVAAPPGGYYLFVNGRNVRTARAGTRGGRRSGTSPSFTGKRGAKAAAFSSAAIPSVARIVLIGATANRRQAVQPIPDQGRVEPPAGGATATQDSSTTLPGDCQACNPTDHAEPDKGATPSSGAATLGYFTRPFEEGGSAQPRCTRRASDGFILCKPAMSSSNVLVDGTLLYWDNLSATENSRSFVVDGGDLGRNSPSRHADLRGGAFRWMATPVPEDGGARSPNIQAGNPNPALGLPIPTEDALNMQGGLVFGGLTQPAPDDNTPANNDGDLFCGGQVQLSDGRILVAGGTDWYSEPLKVGDAPVPGTVPVGVP